MIAVSETELAALVVRHLEEMGAEVYQEVTLGGPRADIVARIGSVLHVVEVKKNAGLRVLEQAHEWIPYAHRVSIAVPPASRFAYVIAKRLGIGILEVRVGDAYGRSEVRERVAPELRRRVDPRLAAALCEEQKTYAAAGNNAGRFWSPFKATCEALREIVTETPGLTWREAIKRTKHHYRSSSSAASTLYRLAQMNVAELAWLACSSERPARLYLAGDPRATAPAQRTLEEIAS